MQLFIVKLDGEVHEIKDDKPIKDLMQATECYIVNDDDARTVYLWKGTNSSVRGKFIGASKSQEVRGQVGMNYKCTPIDQDSEPPEFIEAIKRPPGKGFAKEIKETLELKFEVGGGPIKPRVAQSVTGGLNEKLQQTGPLYTGGQPSGAVAAAAQREESEKKEVSKDMLDKIVEKLDAEGMPEGFEREMVIMGDTAYSVTEKVKTFLGNKTTERVMEPISSLPEGIFFAQNYCPRVYVQNHVVIAIEFLKKKE